jgi:GNAT superfamily N-acetyltransferase
LDQRGVLLVAEITPKEIDTNDEKLIKTAGSPENRLSSVTNQVVVGVSHAYVCPKGKQIWLEGIRINPKYRRMGIASKLTYHMIKHGKEIGSNAREAAAITAQGNIASRRMMEKNEFHEKAKWSYDTGYKRNEQQAHMNGLAIRNKVFENNQGNICDDDTNAICGSKNVSFASPEDIEKIITFLSRSKTSISGGRKYFQSWKWYELDLEYSKISDLVASKKIVIVRTGDMQEIGGLAITNNSLHNEYCAEQNQREDKEQKQGDNGEEDVAFDAEGSSLQIVYVDVPTSASLKNLLVFVVNIVLSSSLFDRIQLFIPNQKNHEFYEISEVLAKFGISKSESFLLYTRSI